MITADSIGFLEWLHDSVAIFDNEYKVLYANRTFRANFYSKYGTELILGTSLLEYYQESDRIKWLACYKRVLTGKSFQVRHDYSEGEYVSVVNFSFTPIYQEETITGFSIFGRDVSEFKVAANALEDSNRLLSKRNTRLEEFSYMLAHNIKSPLSNIVALLRLHEKGESEAEKVETIGLLGVAVKKLHTVLNELIEVLNFNKTEDLILDNVIFDEILEDAKLVFSSLITEHKVQIISHFLVSEHTCVHRYVYGIFLNLISNSIKYRQLDSPLIIKIESYRVGKKVVIKFTDNGLGMDMARVKDKIFRPYKTFHYVPEAKGLGLFLTRTQIEIMGGTIDFESEVNKGTTFTITL